MRNSKFCIPLKIVAFVLLFLLLVFLLNTFVTPLPQESWRTLSYLSSHHDVDTLFLGSSVTQRSNVPLVIDEETGLSSCNLATSAQTFMASYYLLKEALKTNDLQHVVLQVYISRFQDNPIDDFFIYDTVEDMPFSLNKLSLIVNAYSVENYPDALFRCYRTRAILQEMFKTDEETVIDEASSVVYPAEVAPYIGKGYFYTASQLNPSSIWLNDYDVFDRAKIKPANTLYLQKIIDLCKQKGIDLVFMATPRVAGNILATGNYSEFHDYVKAIADENQIPFWDYVYVRPDVLRVSEDMFFDSRHANYRLAVPLSRVVGRMLREHIDGTLDESCYLYGDFSRFESQNLRITGIFVDSLSSDETVAVHAITGGGVIAQYRFSLAATSDDEYVVIQDWSEQNAVNLSDQPDQSCRLRVEVRQPGTDSPVEQRVYVALDL